MPSVRRKPSEIALEILDCIDKEGQSSKWGLLKILGTGSQFTHWIDDFLVKEKFVIITKVDNHYSYRKTELGEQLHELLKNGRIVSAFLQLSGKRLRRK